MDEQDQEHSWAVGFVLALVIALVIAITIWASQLVKVPTKPKAATDATPAVATAAPAASAAKWSLAAGAGGVTLSGLVPDDASKARMLEQAKLLWGDDKVTDQLLVQSGAALPQWKGKLLDLYARIRGLSDGALTLDASAAVLEGKVGSDADKVSIGEWFAGFLPEGTTLDNRLTVDAALAKAPKADPNVLLNLAIEFASGKADLPEAVKPGLVKLAGMLSEDGRKLRIVGHTDNKGHPESNRALSRRRAESVRAFLVLNGVPDSNLVAEGAGADKPVADNLTAEGRQRNRRIEFSQ